MTRWLSRCLLGLAGLALLFACGGAKTPPYVEQAYQELLDELEDVPPAEALARLSGGA